MFTIWKAAEEKSGRAVEYALSPEVVMVLLPDGTARLLDMAGGFFGLPAVGAEMLRAVLENGVASAVTELARRYEAPQDQLRTDLNALLADLQRRGMVRAGSSRPCAKMLWPSLVLVPMLWLIRRLPFAKARAVALLTLAYLSFAWFGWSRTVAVWRRRFRGPVGGAGSADEKRVEAVDRLVREAAAGLPFAAACKERAVCCWALARAAGAPAVLVVGLELFPLGGHCWCEAGGRTLSDDEDRCQFYTPVLRYA